MNGALYTKRCDHCNAPIFWAVLPNGLIPAFDATPRPEGPWRILRVLEYATRTHRGRVARRGAAEMARAYPGDQAMHYGPHRAGCGRVLHSTPTSQPNTQQTALNAQGVVT